MSYGDAHDHLFRYGFSRLEVARAHFETYLPRSVVDAIDWQGLEREAETFVDPDLRGTQSDLVYRAPLKAGGTAYLYILFEHQRTLDYQMPFRLLAYMVRIWGHWIKENVKPRRKPRLPFIFPMVLYNGIQPWTVSDRFADLFPRGALQDALGEQIPNFQYFVQDLSRIPDEQIRGAALGQMILLLLKWGDKAELWERFPDWLATMRTILRQPSLGMDAIEAMLRYVIHVNDQPPPDTIRPQIRQSLTPKAEEMLMSWAEQLKQQGFEQGLEQGIERGLEQGIAQTERAHRERTQARVLRMLRLKFGSLSAADEQKVTEAATEALEQWTERILTAQTLDAVFSP